MLGFATVIFLQNILHCAVVKPKLDKNQAFQSVNRFSSIGGGWGYSPQSVDAIQFCANRDIKLAGVRLFTRRSAAANSQAKVSLYASVVNEVELILLYEKAMVSLTNADEGMAELRFSQPIQCGANMWYTVAVGLNGPNTNCGAKGLPSCVGTDGTIFRFAVSRLCNNGTDVRIGQIM